MALRSNMILLTAAIIWGIAFVAQRIVMEHMPPFAFNGIRFALGGLVLLPFAFWLNILKQEIPQEDNPASYLKVGIAAGCILYLGSSLQQVGLVYTTAGKAAFITCLYIVLVPIIGIFMKHSVSNKTWLGCILTIIGLYFLSIKESLYLEYGDLAELIGAFFWAGHIILISRYANKLDSLKLAVCQFFTCASLSLITAFLFESVTIQGIKDSLIPIFFMGIFSTAIAYTLQIIGQKHAEPTHTAIIFSLEAAFAALGGYLVLDEKLTFGELFGCLLMFSGMIIAQLPNKTSHFSHKAPDTIK